MRQGGGKGGRLMRREMGVMGEREGERGGDGERGRGGLMTGEGEGEKGVEGERGRREKRAGGGVPSRPRPGGVRKRTRLARSRI